MAQIAALKLADRDIHSLLEWGIEALAQQPIEVDGATEQLEVALAEEQVVLMLMRVVNGVGVLHSADKLLVQNQTKFRGGKKFEKMNKK